MMVFRVDSAKLSYVYRNIHRVVIKSLNIKFASTDYELTYHFFDGDYFIVDNLKSWEL